MAGYRQLAINHAGEIALRMVANGYNSVFERVTDTSHRGPKIWVFWINLATGESKITVTEGWSTDVLEVKTLTTIDHRAVGETDYSQLTAKPAA